MKKKRLKIALGTMSFLAALAMYCVYVGGHETVATTAVAGILTISTIFIGGDSYRKSE